MTNVLIHKWETKRKNDFIHNALISYISSGLCHFITFPFQNYSKNIFNIGKIFKISGISSIWKESYNDYRKQFLIIKLLLPIKDFIRNKIFFGSSNDYQYFIKSYPVFCLYNFSSGFLTAILFGLLSYEFSFLKPSFSYFYLNRDIQGFNYSREKSRINFPIIERIRIMRLVLPCIIWFRTVYLGLFDCLKGKIIKNSSGFFTILICSIFSTSIAFLISFPRFKANLSDTNNQPIEYEIVNEYFDYKFKKGNSILKSMNVIYIINSALMMAIYEYIKNLRKIDLNGYKF